MDPQPLIRPVGLVWFLRRSIEWLAGTISDELLDAAIITTGRDAYRRTDGIAVIPAALLTA